MMAVSDANEEAVLDPPLVIQSSFQDQLARIGDGEPLQIFDRSNQPEP